MELFSELAVDTGSTWFDLVHYATGDVVRHPTNGEPVRLCLHSPDSEPMRAFEVRVQQRTYDKLGRQGAIEMSAEENEKLSTVKATTALADWENLPGADGSSIPFSEQAAKDILSNPKYRWIRDFIEQKLRNRGNFPGTSAPAVRKPKAA